MADRQCLEPVGEDLLTACKVGGLSQISGVKKQTLRRYDRIGMLSHKPCQGTGPHLYARHDLIRLERLSVMQMIGLSRSQIIDCLQNDRRLVDELQLQRKILLEKRKRLNRVIYFIEYAEQVNRDDRSEDWHYLGHIIEALTMLRDPEWFKQYYIRGDMD